MKNKEKIIKFINDLIVEHEFNLKHLFKGKDDDELIGFCRGLIEGLKQVHEYIKND